MIFTFQHVDLGQTKYGKWSDGKVRLTELKQVMTKWEDGLEGKAWNSLYWDNHDQPRAVSRFGNDSGAYREISAKMLATCLHFMKGTPYVYQGEELGMTNRKCTSFTQYRDIEIRNAYQEYVESGILTSDELLAFVNAVGRDNARFPMQWEDTINAGFTTGTPWIDVNENYRTIHAAAQVNDERSVYSYYKKLIALRHKLDVMVYGEYHLILDDSEEIFAYTRTLDEEKLLVLCNFTQHEVHVPLPDEYTGEEEVVIGNYDDTIVRNQSICLRAYEAKVFYRNN